MKTCQYQNKLDDYIDGALPAEETALIKQHIDDCESCTQEIAEMQKLSALLQSYPRLEPPLEILYNYHTRLEKLFPVKTAPGMIRERIAEFWRRLFDWNPVVLRFAGSAALLVIGIFIGRLMFYSPDQALVNNQPNDVVVLSLDANDLKVVVDYFIKSEILLLAVKNTPDNESLQPGELNLNQELARNLLSSTTLVQQKAALLNDQQISVVLNQIEFMLLEIANTDEQEIKTAFVQLRQMIDDMKLINESENVQKMLKDMI